MDKTPLRIDIISDVVCPWCIIGYRQLEKAVAETSTPVEIHWHPFELNPQMPEEGENLREHLAAKYGTTPEDSVRARKKLTALGAELGFTFNYDDDMRMVNTFHAHRLLHWAGEQGRRHDLKMALFEAFFSRRMNINDPSVLAGIAAMTGLDRDEAAHVLASGEFGEAVRNEEKFSISKGIRGVPAMIFNRKYLVTGAQGVENYVGVLQKLSR